MGYWEVNKKLDWIVTRIKIEDVKNSKIWSERYNKYLDFLENKEYLEFNKYIIDYLKVWFINSYNIIARVINTTFTSKDQDWDFLSQEKTVLEYRKNDEDFFCKAIEQKYNIWINFDSEKTEKQNNDNNEIVDLYATYFLSIRWYWDRRTLWVQILKNYLEENDDPELNKTNDASVFTTNSSEYIDKFEKNLKKNSFMKKSLDDLKYFINLYLKLSKFWDEHDIFVDKKRPDVFSPENIKKDLLDEDLITLTTTLNLVYNYISYFYFKYISKQTEENVYDEKKFLDYFWVYISILENICGIIDFINFKDLISKFEIKLKSNSYWFPISSATKDDVIKLLDTNEIVRKKLRESKDPLLLSKIVLQIKPKFFLLYTDKYMKLLEYLCTQEKESLDNIINFLSKTHLWDLSESRIFFVLKNKLEDSIFVSKKEYLDLAYSLYRNKISLDLIKQIRKDELEKLINIPQNLLLGKNIDGIRIIISNYSYFNALSSKMHYVTESFSAYEKINLFLKDENNINLNPDVYIKRANEYISELNEVVDKNKNIIWNRDYFIFIHILSDLQKNLKFEDNREKNNFISYLFKQKDEEIFYIYEILQKFKSSKKLKFEEIKKICIFLLSKKNLINFDELDQEKGIEEIYLSLKNIFDEKIKESFMEELSKVYSDDLLDLIKEINPNKIIWLYLLKIWFILSDEEKADFLLYISINNLSEERLKYYYLFIKFLHKYNIWFDVDLLNFEINFDFLRDNYDEFDLNRISENSLWFIQALSNKNKSELTYYVSENNKEKIPSIALDNIYDEILNRIWESWDEFDIECLALNVNKFVENILNDFCPAKLSSTKNWKSWDWSGALVRTLWKFIKRLLKKQSESNFEYISRIRCFNFRDLYNISDDKEKSSFSLSVIKSMSCENDLFFKSISSIKTTIENLKTHNYEDFTNVYKTFEIILETELKSFEKRYKK